MPHSLIVTPLNMRQRTIGFLGAVSYTRGKKFDEGQRKMLRIVANRAAAAIENAKLYEDLKATFQQTIKGLASAIDKMDRYTSGHSERVAAYAQILAIKLGLPEEEVEIVRQAALMHDIGKIGCVMNLNKPGKLCAGRVRDLQAAPRLREGHPRADHVPSPARCRACTFTTSAGTGAATRSASRRSRTSRSWRASSPWPTPTTR